MPAHVEVYELVAAAALHAKQGVALWTWALMRAHPGNRHGWVTVEDAVALQCETRSITARRAHQVLEASTFWTRARGRVYLHSAARVAAALEVAHLGQPHRIPVEGVRSKRDITLALFAAVRPLPVHRVDIRRLVDGAVVISEDAYMPERAPLTRALLENLTGLSVGYQRALDNAGGATALVERVYATLPDSAGEPVPVGPYVRSWSGRLVRRFGDRRTAPTHRPGSRAAHRHVRRELSRRLSTRADAGTIGLQGADEPVHPRVWYVGRGRDDAQRQAQRDGARFAVLVWPEARRMRREVVRA